MANKIIKRGFFNKDIYEANGRYPIDAWENYTLDDIQSMFSLVYKKGTKVNLYNDGGKDNPTYVWYLNKDRDGGWYSESKFAKTNITIKE